MSSFIKLWVGIFLLFSIPIAVVALMYMWSDTAGAISLMVVFLLVVSFLAANAIEREM